MTTDDLTTMEQALLQAFRDLSELEQIAVMDVIQNDDRTQLDCFSYHSARLQAFIDVWTAQHGTF